MQATDHNVTLAKGVHSHDDSAGSATCKSPGFGLEQMERQQAMDLPMRFDCQSGLYHRKVRELITQPV